jgi:hypothetical protein
MSIESLIAEQKIQVSNKFIKKICERYHNPENVDREFKTFKDGIMNGFKECLSSHGLNLPDKSRDLISKKIKLLHSRLVAPSEQIEFEVITDWEIEMKPFGREINNDKKIFCKYFKEWFASGKICICP